MSSEDNEVGANPGLTAGGCVYDAPGGAEVAIGVEETGEDWVIGKGAADVSGVEVSDWEE